MFLHLKMFWQPSKEDSCNKCLQTQWQCFDQIWKDPKNEGKDKLEAMAGCMEKAQQCYKQPPCSDPSVFTPLGTSSMRILERKAMAESEVRCIINATMKYNDCVLKKGMGDASCQKESLERMSKCKPPLDVDKRSYDVMKYVTERAACTMNPRPRYLTDAGVNCAEIKPPP